MIGWGVGSEDKRLQRINCQIILDEEGRDLVPQFGSDLVQRGSSLIGEEPLHRICWSSEGVYLSSLSK